MQVATSSYCLPVLLCPNPASPSRVPAGPSAVMSGLVWHSQTQLPSSAILIRVAELSEPMSVVVNFLRSLLIPSVISSIVSCSPDLASAAWKPGEVQVLHSKPMSSCVKRIANASISALSNVPYQQVNVWSSLSFILLTLCLFIWRIIVYTNRMWSMLSLRTKSLVTNRRSGLSSQFGFFENVMLKWTSTCTSSNGCFPMSISFLMLNGFMGFRTSNLETVSRLWILT
mmetsp:Transcript_4303/g.8022  ORF Transcript_4303/g.8022 Transcript_4303/m.8022 type:complete len:228 (-) Transcript_4303:3082-3765(-)